MEIALGNGFMTRKRHAARKPTSKNSKEWLGVNGDVVEWGPKAEEWILHKNSAGWSVMLKSNGAMAVSLNKKKDGLELQRNQGEPQQLWVIEKEKK